MDYLENREYVTEFSVEACNVFYLESSQYALVSAAFYCPSVFLERIRSEGIAPNHFASLQLFHAALAVMKLGSQSEDPKLTDLLLLLAESIGDEVGVAQIAELIELHNPIHLPEDRFKAMISMAFTSLRKRRDLDNAIGESIRNGRQHGN